MTGYKTCKHNRTGQECDSWADVMDFMGVSGGLKGWLKRTRQIMLMVSN
jgi:hypothetical protein